MIFTDSFLYLHPPKTGGMALSDALLQALKGDVFYAVPQGHGKPSAYGEKIITGNRHGTLIDASQFFSAQPYGKQLSDFETIVSVMRSPYDLEISRYFYLRKGHAWDKGKAQELALAGNFAAFVENSKWWFDFKDYYLINDAKPDNLHIIRYEHFGQQIQDRFASYFKQPLQLTRKNMRGKNDGDITITAELEQLIYTKYQWFFDAGYFDRKLSTDSDEQLEIDSDKNEVSESFLSSWLRKIQPAS